MKRWIRMVSMCGFTLFLFLVSPVMTATTVHAGTVLAQEEKNIPAPKLNVTSKSMVKDSTYALRVYNLTENHKVSYKSSDSKVVSVSRLGVLTAKDIGNATITVSLKDTSTGTSSILICDVTVGTSAVSIKLSLKEVTLQVGKKTTLQTILKPNTTIENPIFGSLNKEVAAVSADGTVTGKSVGETVIYALIGNGKYAECVVTVVDESTEEPVEETEEETTEVEDSSDKKNTTDSVTTE